MSSYDRIEVRPIAGALGAEVDGVDLSRPLDPATFQEIHDALMEYLVLFFRDQDITPEQHKDFGRRFGELHVHPYIPSLEGHPEIIVLEHDAERPPRTNNWHCDVTFDPKPPMGAVLHAKILPRTGGDTMWSNMYAAYEALSAPMQDFLSGLSATHDSIFKKGRENEPPAEHPVLRTHPVTGRKAVFVNSAFTRRIVGLKPKESLSLIRFLSEHVRSEDFTCRFRWRVNSIALWDNRCTQHYAMADYSELRRMHRVTILGDRPV